MDWSGCTNDGTANGVATIKCIDVVIHNLISAAFIFAGSVAAIIIILAGIKFVRSQGDPKNLQSARQALTWGIIGLVIVILAYGIVTLIGSLTGTSNSCIFSFLKTGTGFGTCQ